MNAFALASTVHTAAVEHHTVMNVAQRVTTRTSWSWAGDETGRRCLTGDGRCAGHWECSGRLNQHWGLRRCWILTRRMWPKMEYRQKYVKVQGDTSLCNVNKTVKGPDHPGARVAVKRQEQPGVSSQGAKDLPQGLAEGEFASSDRTRRWTCLLRVTAQAREEEHKTPQQQAPPDMQTGQSIRACLRRGVPADHEAHSRSGDSCEESQRLSFGGSAPRRPKQGKARTWQRTTIAPHAEQTRAERRHGMTSGTRPGGEEGPPWTIAGKQSRAKPDERCSVQTFEAEAPATRCSQRRTRVATDTAWRSSRPAWSQRPPHAQQVKERAKENTWVSTWTATLENHGVPWRATHGAPWRSRAAHGVPWRPQENSASPWQTKASHCKRRCVRRSRGETEALAKQRRRGANTAQGEVRNVNRWMILEKKLKERTYSG